MNEQIQRKIHELTAELSDQLRQVADGEILYDPERLMLLFVKQSKALMKAAEAMFILTAPQPASEPQT